MALNYSRVIIHPGYPKTGTTTLQSSLWPVLCRDNGWRYFGKEYAADGASKTEAIVREFVRSFPLWDEATVQRNAESIRSRFGLLPRYDGETLFVSLEEPILRSLKAELVGGMPTTDDLSGTFRKLLALFTADFTNPGPIQMIVMIRRQADLIPSLYAQGYQHFFRYARETASLERYITEVIEHESYPWLASPLYYDAVVRSLFSTFGRSNVAIIPFEMLRVAPTDFLGTIFTFLGIPDRPYPLPQRNQRGHGNEWKSRDYSLLAAIRRMRKQRGSRRVPPWIRKPVTNALRRIPLHRVTTIQQTHTQRASIDAHFHDSNEKTTKLIDVDLSYWGYY